MADKKEFFEDPFNTVYTTEPPETEFDQSLLTEAVEVSPRPETEKELEDPFSVFEEEEISYDPYKADKPPTYQELKDAGVEDYDILTLSNFEKARKKKLADAAKVIPVPPQSTAALSLEDTAERSFPKLESGPLRSLSGIDFDEWLAENTERERSDSSSYRDWVNYRRELGFREGADLIDFERQVEQDARSYIEQSGTQALDRFFINKREEILGASFVEDYLGITESEFIEDLNDTQRKTLIDSAKIEAVDRGDYAFARVEVEDENGNVGSRIHLGKNTITDVEELKREADKALKAGLIEPVDLASIQKILKKTNVGDLQFNRAQLTQLNLELDNIMEDTTSIANAFLQRVLHYQLVPSNTKYKDTGLTGGKGFLKPLQPPTIQDALQPNALVQDDLYRPVQKQLLVNDYRRRGRYEEANDIMTSKDMSWVSKYIGDERTHKYGLKNLRSAIFEQAASFVNSNGAFKYFEDINSLYKNIRITPKGTILIHPKLNYNKKYFSVAIGSMKDSEGNKTTLSSEQIQELYAAREAYILNNWEEIDRLLREVADESVATKWSESVAENDKKSPEDALSRVDLFDEFYDDTDENFKSLFGEGVRASIKKAFTDMYHGVAASIFGSEFSANVLVKEAEQEADRRKYNNIWGDEFGTMYDISTLVAPVAADIFAGGAIKKSVAGIGAVSKLAEAGAKPGLLNYSKVFVGYGLGARKGMSYEDLADNFIKQSTIRRGTLDAVSDIASVKQSVTQSIKSYNTLLADRLNIDAAIFLPAANRSAAGMYSSVYSSLKAQNPDATHEELHAMSMLPALGGGALTGFITFGFSNFGFGGLEKVFLENVPFKRAVGVLKNIKVRGLGSKGLPITDDSAKLFFKNIMDREIRKVLANNLREGGLGVAEEGFSEAFEEALDTFVNSFVETWATGEEMTFGDRVLQAGHAFKLGGIFGAGARTARSGTRALIGATPLGEMMEPDFSDPELYAQRAITEVSEELEQKLKDTNSPLTASYISQILQTPAGATDTTEPESIPRPRILSVEIEDRQKDLEELREAIKFQDLTEGPGSITNLPKISDSGKLELAKADVDYNVSSDGVILGIKDENGEWVGFAPDQPKQVRQLDTDVNDFTNPVVAPADLGTVQGVSVELDRWATSDMNKASLKSKSISIDTSSKTEGIADVDITNSPKGLGQPVIRINKEGLSRRLAEVPEGERYNLFNKILGEELTHAAEIVQFIKDYKDANGSSPTEQELKTYVNSRHLDMYNDMAIQERKNVVAAYLNIKQDEVVLPEESTSTRPASMSEQAIAAEFIRMLVQYEKSEQTTESAQWLTSNEIATFMRGVFDRIKKGFLSSKKGFTGPVAQELRKHLNNIQEILADFAEQAMEMVSKEDITEAIDESALIDNIDHGNKEWEFLEKPGTPLKDVAWRNGGRKRDGSAMLHRDKKVKVVKRIDTTSKKTVVDQTKDKYELVDLESGEIIGEYGSQLNAFNAYREIQEKESSIESDFENVEPPQDPTINNDTDQKYVDLVESQSIDENMDEIQDMVFEAVLTPQQIQAVKGHAEAVASGKQDQVNSARAQVVGSGLGTGVLDAINGVSNPTKALKNVVESFGLDSTPIVEDSSGTLQTLSVRFPTSDQIIPLDPKEAGTIDRSEELRVVELAKKAIAIAQQWGIDTRLVTNPPVDRGAMWVDNNVLYINPNQLSLETSELSEQGASDYVEALSFVQVAIVQSYETHSQQEIKELIDETSDAEIADLVSEVYSEQARDAAINRASGNAEGGELTAAQELTNLMRYKMARDAVRIVNGQAAIDVDGYVNQKPTFKGLFVAFLNRVVKRFSYYKRIKANNAAYADMLNNLIGRLRAYKGSRRQPSHMRFDPRKPFATVEMAQDILADQQATYSEDAIPTSASKNARVSLANVANSQSYHSGLAQSILDNHKGKTLDGDLDLPAVSTPAEILVAYFEADLKSFDGVFDTLDSSKSGFELYTAMQDRYKYLSEGDPDRPALSLLKAYLDFVDVSQVSLMKSSPNSFSGYITRMLKDPVTQLQSVNTPTGFVNNWTSFVIAATKAIKSNQKGDFNQTEFREVLDSAYTEDENVIKDPNLLANSDERRQSYNIQLTASFGNNHLETVNSRAGTEEFAESFDKLLEVFEIDPIDKNNLYRMYNRLPESIRGQMAEFGVQPDSDQQTFINGFSRLSGVEGLPSRVYAISDLVQSIAGLQNNLREKRVPIKALNLTASDNASDVKQSAVGVFRLIEYLNGEPLVTDGEVLDTDFSPIEAAVARKHRFGVQLPTDVSPGSKYLGNLIIANDGTLPVASFKAQVENRSGITKPEIELTQSIIDAHKYYDDVKKQERVNVGLVVDTLEGRTNELVSFYEWDRGVVAPTRLDTLDFVTRTQLKHNTELWDVSDRGNPNQFFLTVSPKADTPVKMKTVYLDDLEYTPFYDEQSFYDKLTTALSEIENVPLKEFEGGASNINYAEKIKRKYFADYLLNPSLHTQKILYMEDGQGQVVRQAGRKLKMDRRYKSLFAGAESSTNYGLRGDVGLKKLSELAYKFNVITELDNVVTQSLSNYFLHFPQRYIKRREAKNMFVETLEEVQQNPNALLRSVFDLIKVRFSKYGIEADPLPLDLLLNKNLLISQLEKLHIFSDENLSFGEREVDPPAEERLSYFTSLVENLNDIYTSFENDFEVDPFDYSDLQEYFEKISKKRSLLVTPSINIHMPRDMEARGAFGLEEEDNGINLKVSLPLMVFKILNPTEFISDRNVGANKAYMALLKEQILLLGLTGSYEFRDTGPFYAETRINTTKTLRDGNPSTVYSSIKKVVEQDLISDNDLIKSGVGESFPRPSFQILDRKQDLAKKLVKAITPPTIDKNNRIKSNYDAEIIIGIRNFFDLKTGNDIDPFIDLAEDWAKIFGFKDFSSLEYADNIFNRLGLYNNFEEDAELATVRKEFFNYVKDLPLDFAKELFVDDSDTMVSDSFDLNPKRSEDSDNLSYSLIAFNELSPVVGDNKFVDASAFDYKNNLGVGTPFFEDVPLQVDEYDTPKAPTPTDKYDITGLKEIQDDPYQYIKEYEIGSYSNLFNGVYQQNDDHGYFSGDVKGFPLSWSRHYEDDVLPFDRDTGQIVGEDPPVRARVLYEVQSNIFQRRHAKKYGSFTRVKDMFGYDPKQIADLVFDFLDGKRDSLPEKISDALVSMDIFFPALGLYEEQIIRVSDKLNPLTDKIPDNYSADELHDSLFIDFAEAGNGTNMGPLDFIVADVLGKDEEVIVPAGTLNRTATNKLLKYVLKDLRESHQKNITVRPSSEELIEAEYHEPETNIEEVSSNDVRVYAEALEDALKYSISKWQRPIYAHRNLDGFKKFMVEEHGYTTGSRYNNPKLKVLSFGERKIASQSTDVESPRKPIADFSYWDEPLIEQAFPLALQQAVIQARDAGLTHIMLVDASTAALTQGHDLNAKEPAYLDHTTGEMKGTYAGHHVNYDVRGPEILKKLTGDEGVDATAGEHKRTAARNTLTFKSGGKRRWDQVSGRLFKIPGALATSTYSVKKASDGFNPPQASTARKPQSNINSSRVVEMIDFPIFEAGGYEGSTFLSGIKGKLDPRLRRMIELRRSYQKYLGAEIQEYKRVLDKILIDDFGGREFVDPELLSRVTGSTKGVMISQEVRNKIEDEYEKAEELIMDSENPREVKDELLRRANATRLERLNEEEQKQRVIILADIENAKAELREQSPKLVDHLENMRERIDEMSKELVNYLGGDEELKMHFDNQLGLYLTRSFRVFSEEGWIDTVMESPSYEREKNAALKYFEDYYIEERIENILKAKRKEWLDVPLEEQKNRARKTARQELIDSPSIPDEYLRAFLLDYTKNLDATGNPVLSNTDPVDSFRKKLSDKELPPELRAVMGEYKEDTGDFNLMRTFLNVGNIASQQAFLRGIIDLGRLGTKDQYWILTKQEVKARIDEGKLKEGEYETIRELSKIPEQGKRVGATRYDPLLDFIDENGKHQGPLYAPTQMARDFREEFSYDPLAGRKVVGSVLDKVLRFLTGASLGIVTLGSVPFYIRNITSNLLFFGPAQGLMPLKGTKSALKEMARELNFTEKDLDAERKKLIRLGVLGDEFTTNMLVDLLEGQINERTLMRDLNNELDGLYRKNRDKTKKGVDEFLIGKSKTVTKKLRDLSIAADAFYKITLYRHELKTLKKAQRYAINNNLNDKLGLKDTTVWTEDKLEQEAARKTLATAQSYSQRIPVTQSIARSSVGVLFAPFIGFKLEIPRIAVNTEKVAKEDIASGNPVLVRRGRARRYGFRTSMALSAGGRVFGYSKLISILFGGVDDEEDEALRAGASTWGKNFSYQYFRDPVGRLLKVHQTYINPWAMYGDGPARFFENALPPKYGGKGELEIGLTKLAEGVIGTPFLDGQIFASGLFGAIKGDDDFGNQLETDPAISKQLLARGKYLIDKSFSPPTLKALFGERMRAAMENRRSYGSLFDGSFDINKFFGSPEGMAVAQLVPTKAEVVDPTEYADRHYRTVSRLKSGAYQNLRGIDTGYPTLTDAVKEQVAKYQESYRYMVEQALAHQRVYKEKWKLSDDFIKENIESLIGKDNYRTYKQFGYVKVPPLSEGREKELRSSEEQDVRDRLGVIRDEMSKRDMIYIRPNAQGILKASFTPPPNE